MHRRRKLPIKVYLALALFPFVVGFGPPQHPGTYASIAGGGGHYVSTPSCSPPELTDYRDYQVAVGHQSHAVDRFGTRLGLGAQADVLTSESKVCDIKGCKESDSSVHDRGAYWAAGAFATADWTYLGLRIGGHLHTKTINSDTHGAARDWLPTQLDGGARLGPEWLYVSGDLEAAAPLLSGGGPIEIGLGGRLYGTDLWGGVAPGGLQARVSRDFGPLRLGLAGAYGRHSIEYSLKDPSSPEGTLDRRVSIPEYRAAAQLGYSFR